MRVFTAMIVVALSACGTKSDVIPTGKSTYLVRSPKTGGGPAGDAEIKAYGIRRANEFCDAEGKHAIVNIGETGGLQLFNVQRAEVRFSCVDK
ncbi:MAG TPA: hypothetical protein VFF72_08550 [Caldimonas sp.]|nr:hypothetical protein [Caldimonas sp.]